MRLKITLSVFAVLIVSLAITLIRLCRQAEEIDRLSANQNILLHNGRVELKQTSDGKSAAAVEALTLRVGELSRAGDSLLQLTQVLKIKNRRLMSLAQSVGTTHAAVRTIVRDSIVRLPGRIDTLPCLAYHDAWLSFSGCIRADSFVGDIRSRDTLNIIVHRVPRRFLFFRWGCKAVKMEAVSSNPHTRLTYLRYIRFTQ